MTWNIAPEFVSLVMLGIIWVYARKGSHLPTLKNRMFQGCLMVTFCAMLTNILSTLMLYSYSIVPLWIIWIVTTIYFILTPLMGLVYFFYTISVIYTDSRKQKKLLFYGSIPGAFYVIAVLVNPLTRNIFDLTPKDGYTRGAFIFTTYLVFYAYCAASIVITILNRKKMEREIYRILASFPILAVLVIVIQQMFSDIILTGSAATCALLLIYLHLQNKQITMDYLTNIPNRQELLNMMSMLIKRHQGKIFTLLVISLRDFRQVNNTAGQHNGDALLKAVCQFICSVGPRNNVYRFGGDEFAVLFCEEEDKEIRRCIEAVKERFAEPWQINDYRFAVSAVMGVIRHTDSTETLERAISAVEYAVAQAKSGECGQICYCDKAMLDGLDRRRQIVQILKDKLAAGEFEMYYQPIYSVEKGEFLHAESLMRMNDTPIGPIYPSEFIPIAEETGLIIDITYVILDKVCKFINRLREDKIPVHSVHINFSAVQFSQPDLAEKVIEIIRNNKTPMSAVEIEFTESTLAENPGVVTEFAQEMQRHDILMGLDDFGTGYSNIATVLSIPFGTMKLDKSLVWTAVKNKTSALAVKNLVRTFNELGMRVIAEGVETEEQRKFVVDSGVDEIQGFYYSKPLPEDEMEQFLVKHKKKAE